MLNLLLGKGVSKATAIPNEVNKEPLVKMPGLFFCVLLAMPKHLLHHCIILGVVPGLEENPKSGDWPVESVSLLHCFLVNLLPVRSQHLALNLVGRSSSALLVAHWPPTFRAHSTALLQAFQAMRGCDGVVGTLHQRILTEDQLSLVNVPRGNHHPAHPRLVLDNYGPGLLVVLRVVEEAVVQTTILHLAVEVTCLRGLPATQPAARNLLGLLLLLV